MSLIMIREMIEYQYWARDRVLNRLEDMAPEDYLGDSQLDYSSIHETLMHQLQTENGVRSIIEGLALVELNPDGLSELVAAWRAEEAEWRRLVSGLAEADLDRAVTYEDGAGDMQTNALWQVVLHVFGHCLQHLAEVALAMTHLGYSPGNLDYMEYVHPGV